MKSLNKYVVIEKVKNIEPAKTSGGLYVGKADKEAIRYIKGIVILPNENVGVKPGDYIYFDKHAGFNINIGDDQYLCIKESDIVVVL